MTLAFHVTDRCQLDCEHCLRDPGKTPKDLPVEVLAKVLDEGSVRYRATHVALTGGEPLLHPRFLDLVDAIAVRGMTFHMVTNGKRVPWLLCHLDARPAWRAALSAVDLSLDGADDAVHDAIRGAGSFVDVMIAAAACAARDIRFVLQMTLHKKNAHQIEQMGLLAASLGACRLSFAMMQPTGTFLDEGLRLSAREWRAVQDRVERLAAALTLPVSMPEGFARAEPFHACAPMRSEILHVDVAGRLTLCCQHAGVPGGDGREVAGDVATGSLVAAHKQLLTIIHEAERETVELIERGVDDEWDLFPCNRCMRSFGKPHWTKDGAAGPTAARERWRGAWAKAPHQAGARAAASRLAVIP